MKKIIFVPCVAILAACANTVTLNPEAEYIRKLDAEPVGCTFLYKLESESSVYDRDDAERFLKNRIAEQTHKGNAFWIVSERTRENPSAVFGPKKSFVFTANVYECESN